ncbi:dolichol phosphate-mannose biosynthesis regulatory protein-like [Actinia tenebrosa]|uniref:Dolichol phosphate-mannose biosynthesis regulatory protein n=1 Tax=Actinia tenebrosa TaxID=6105 RepID=A0A6P8HTF4_ACTTE|nr:dolichol phosphate-mannose biosynthesis regulatory protein-like [Actinia tenebrosa]
MATGLDRAAGMGMVLLGGLIFIYYSIWIIVLPFVESGHILHQFFLPRMYSVIIPVVAGVILLGVIGVFITVIMLKNTKKPKKSN